MITNYWTQLAAKAYTQDQSFKFDAGPAWNWNPIDVREKSSVAWWWYGPRVYPFALTLTWFGIWTTTYNRLTRKRWWSCQVWCSMHDWEKLQWLGFICLYHPISSQKQRQWCRKASWLYKLQITKVSKCQIQNFKVLTLTSNKYLHILLLVYILTKTIDVHNSFEFPRYEQSHQVNAVQFASSRCLHDPERHCG